MKGLNCRILEWNGGVEWYRAWLGKKLVAQGRKKGGVMIKKKSLMMIFFFFFLVFLRF